MKQTFIVNGIDILKQVDELKQENEKLKEENKDLKIYIESNKQQVEEVETLVMDNARLLQTLEEIREYINSQGIDNKWNMRIQRFRMGILNKINEVEE